MKANKWCGQLSSNYTFFADIWFSGVNIVEEKMAEGVDYFGPVKKIHKGFFMATLIRLMKECTGGSRIFIKINPRVPGDRPPMAI